MSTPCLGYRDYPREWLSSSYSDQYLNCHLTNSSGHQRGPVYSRRGLLTYWWLRFSVALSFVGAAFLFWCTFQSLVLFQTFFSVQKSIRDQRGKLVPANLAFLFPNLQSLFLSSEPQVTFSCTFAQFRAFQARLTPIQLCTLIALPQSA